ncbi:MAG: RNA ligase family protein [Nanoarchaeota archaeon]
MLSATNEYVDFPSTPHIYVDSHFGHKEMHSFYTDKESTKLLAGKKVNLEEKLDGSNVGISFMDWELSLQSRKHKIGNHAQYDLLKNWSQVMAEHFKRTIGNKYVVFGEWMFAKHTLEYDALPHYFIGTGVWDKEEGRPISTDRRYALFEELGIPHSPMIYSGEVSGYKHLNSFMNINSEFGPNRIEGLYGRIEKDGGVEAYFKLVDKEFWNLRRQTQQKFPKIPIPNKLIEDMNIVDLFNVPMLV